jgi:hypothetical protein
MVSNQILPFCNDPKAVIPAKAGIQIGKTGFRIKSGMTKSLESFPRHSNIFLILQ